MTITITHYPTHATTAYAELWSATAFYVLPWYAPRQRAEEKGDERGLVVAYKIDIPAACFAIEKSTAAREIELVPVNDIIDLDTPPGPAHKAIRPGVSVLAWEAATTPPPAPGPSPPTPLPQPALTSALVVVQQGHVPPIVQAGEGESPPVIVQADGEWFDRLRDLIEEMD